MFSHGHRKHLLEHLFVDDGECRHRWRHFLLLQVFAALKVHNACLCVQTFATAGSAPLKKQSTCNIISSLSCRAEPRVQAHRARHWCSHSFSAATSRLPHLTLCARSSQARCSCSQGGSCLEGAAAAAGAGSPGWVLGLSCPAATGRGGGGVGGW